MTEDANKGLLKTTARKDPLAGCLMDLAGILYWFNPLVWRALREMLSDRGGASCLLASAGLQINFRLPLLKITG